MPSDLETIIMKSCDLPTMPAIAGRVVSMLSEQNTTAEALTKTISVDPALAARVLKIANSSFYACRRSINTLSQAIVVIGFQTLSNVVFAASTKDVYKRFGLSEKMLHDHAVGTAMATHLVEKAVGLKKSEEVFLAGLLHDIGRVVLNNTDPERYGQVMAAVYNEGRDPLEAEREMFGFTHVDVGGLVLRKWNFSPEMEQVVANHHNIERLDPSDVYVRRMGSLVAVADALCDKIGIGLRAPLETDLAALPAVAGLKLSAETLTGLETALKSSYDAERALFG
jgi:putative nucleotidyltransferase with HDIG domain